MAISFRYLLLFLLVLVLARGCEYPLKEGWDGHPAGIQGE